MSATAQADGVTREIRRQLVAEACGRAAQVLGLSKEELSAVVGKHRTIIDRSGLDPQSKDGDHALMRHWLEQSTITSANNRHGWSCHGSKG